MSTSDGARIRVNIAPELAILAQGRPASRLDDFQASQKERSRYDRLVKRQRELAGQGGLPTRKATGEVGSGRASSGQALNSNLNPDLNRA